MKELIFDLSLVENREFQRKLERNIVRDKTAKVRSVSKKRTQSKWVTEYEQGHSGTTANSTHTDYTV